MPRRSPDRERVLILGGGFAGLAAALELSSDRHDVTLIDRSRWFEFLPNIHELISGVKSPDLLRLRDGTELRGTLQAFTETGLRFEAEHIGPLREALELRG